MKLSINGIEVVAQSGDTVLDAATRKGLSIQHLCTHKALKPFGACRMCLVEIDGMRGYPPSCTTPAAEGMVVRTNTEALRKLQRNILGLTMLEHPSACLVCGKRARCEEYRSKPEKAGRTTGCHTCNNMKHCSVRTMTEDVGLERLPVPPLYHERPLERSNPFIDRDLNLCILCGLCVRICKKHQGEGVIDFVQRGSHTHIGEAFGHTLKEAGCTFCGSCVDACPTGTLSDRFAKWYGNPDHVSATTCAFCGEGCAVLTDSVEGKLLALHSAESFPICVVGRFAAAELLNSAERFLVPKIRVGKNLREVTRDAAVAAVAEQLGNYRGSSFAFVCDTFSTLEDRRVFEQFTREVMQSPNFVQVTVDAKGAGQATLPEGVKAAVLTGALLSPEALRGLDYVVLIDFLPSAVLEVAHAVFPASVFAEVSGSFSDGSGTFRPLRRISDAPGQSLPDWQTVGLWAEAMGAPQLTFAASEEITAQLAIETQARVARNEAPAPSQDITKCPATFRGHALATFVPGLREFDPDGPKAVQVVASTSEDGPFRILSKEEIVPNTFKLVIHAPAVAKRAKAGQFCIAMADETSERVPYTLCDWDAEAGTITLVVLEKGQSSRKLILLPEGGRLAHVTGPLGIPFEVKNYGRVALAGGCYGVGAVGPVARALRAAGNHVTVAVEARSHYLTYLSKQLADASDEFIQTTIDGSTGFKGHAVDAIEANLKAGGHYDLVVAIGCPFMMMLVSELTKPLNIPTQVSLNPIMLDGTGMCGACRVTVGDSVKFACVDGPFFDAHLVDWEEVRDRRQAYSHEEVQSVGLSAPVTVIEKPVDQHHCVAH